MKNRTVAFVERRDVFDHNGKVAETFEAGKSYQMNDSSADRWVRRGAAVDVEHQPKRTAGPRKKKP